MSVSTSPGKSIVEGYVTCRSTGATGVLTNAWHLSGETLQQGVADEVSGTTVDTTGALTLKMSVTYDTSNAGNGTTPFSWNVFKVRAP